MHVSYIPSITTDSICDMTMFCDDPKSLEMCSELTTYSSVGSVFGINSPIWLPSTPLFRVSPCSSCTFLVVVFYFGMVSFGVILMKNLLLPEKNYLYLSVGLVGG